MKRFCELSVNNLKKHAPGKKRYARENQMPFFTKELSKKIMPRCRLTNTLKTEMKKIEPYMLNKEISVYLCYENPKRSIMKT